MKQGVKGFWLVESSRQPSLSSPSSLPFHRRLRLRGAPEHRYGPVYFPFRPFTPRPPRDFRVSAGCRFQGPVEHGLRNEKRQPGQTPSPILVPGLVARPTRLESRGFRPWGKLIGTTGLFEDPIIRLPPLFRERRGPFHVASRHSWASHLSRLRPRQE